MQTPAVAEPAAKRATYLDSTGHTYTHTDSDPAVPLVIVSGPIVQQRRLTADDVDVNFSDLVGIRAGDA